MKERREKERIVIETQPAGSFRMYADGRDLDVFAVRDISPFGVNLQVGDPVDKEVEVRLTYRHGDISLDVYGTIKWSVVSEEAGEGGEIFRSCQAGIYFRPQDMDANLTFFNTLVAG